MQKSDGGSCLESGTICWPGPRKSNFLHPIGHTHDTTQGEKQKRTCVVYSLINIKTFIFNFDYM